MANTRQNVLNVYKNLIKLANRLTPESNRVKTLAMIRSGFREKQLLGHPDSEEYKKRMNDLLKVAQSNISYLRMITPREPGDKSIPPLEKTPSSNRGGKVVSNWSGSNMDPDSVARHKASLKRAGFVNNQHAKGFF